jgi:8-oxo-dGTP diphosphatase
MGIKLGTATLLLDEDGRIALGKRVSTNKHEPGKYGCPGGKVDFGESPQTCIDRELFEETGVRANCLPLGFIANCTYPSEGNHFLCIWFVAFVHNGIELKVELDAEGKPKIDGQWEWFTLDQIRDKSFPIMLSTVDAYQHFEYGYLGKFEMKDYAR